MTCVQKRAISKSFLDQFIRRLHIDLTEIR